jgi:hypothetical protein
LALRTARAFPVTEAVDQFAAHQRMVFVAVHVMPFEQVPPQGLVVSIEHRAARARVRTGDVLLDIMAAVEHRRRVALDAHIADTQEQRASGLADSLDTKQFA